MGDYSVCITAGVKGGQVFILDVFRERLEIPDLLTALKNQAVRWQPRKILIEDASSGTALHQMIKRETKLPIVPVAPFRGGGKDGAKIAHANSNIAYIEGGRVIFCRGAYLTDFETELLSFPAAAHDDQTDALNVLLSAIFQTGPKKAAMY